MTCSLLRGDEERRGDGDKGGEESAMAARRGESPGGDAASLGDNERPALRGGGGGEVTVCYLYRWRESYLLIYFFIYY